MVAKKKEAQCLVPGCKRPRAHRGMCSACYRRALRMVSSGRRTWKFFEHKGWARKKGKAGRPATNSLDKALMREANQ